MKRRSVAITAVCWVALAGILLLLFAGGQPSTAIPAGDEKRHPPPVEVSRGSNSLTFDHPYCSFLRRSQYNSTAGRHLDAFGTGNAVVDSVDSADLISSAPVSSLWDEKQSHEEGGHNGRRAVVSTRFQRHNQSKQSPMCFYRVHSACIVHGQLVLFQDSVAPARDAGPVNNSSEENVWSTFTRTTGVNDGTAFRLCNELRRKINFRFSWRTWPVNRDPIDQLPTVESWREYAHVVACWQLYGFHLLECLASAYFVERLHGLVDVDLLVYNHAVSLPRASSQHYSHASFFGSNTSFDDPISPLAKQLNYLPNPFWGFFGQNSKDPANVFEVRRAPFQHGETRCYKRLLVGQPDPRALGDHARQVHARRLRDLLGVSHLPRRSVNNFCSTATARVTITQRGGRNVQQNLQGRRGFANLADIVVTASNTTFPLCQQEEKGSSVQANPNCGAVRTDVSVTDWSGMPLREQAATAASTNILIATHGAGNLWLTFLPPRSVLIEVWPNCIGRNVYVTLAKQHNIRYIPVCHPPDADERRQPNATAKKSELNSAKNKKTKAANFMNDDVFVNNELLREALSAALGFLVESYNCCSTGAGKPV